MLSFVLGVALGAIVAFTGPSLLPQQFRNAYVDMALRLIGIAAIVFAVASTSFVRVPDGHLGQLFRVYGGGSLSEGRIVAVHGENGPQASILTPGFHPWLLVNVLYDVDTSHLEVSIPKGKAGILTAKDGAPLRAGQAFADPFPSKFGDQMLDAEVFLLNGGQRGPQLTVLTPAISFKAAPKWKFPRTRTTPTLRCSSRWKAGTCPSNCASLRGYRQRKRRVWWPASAL